jgi:hypothetical protein
MRRIHIYAEEDTYVTFPGRSGAPKAVGATNGRQPRYKKRRHGTPFYRPTASLPELLGGGGTPLWRAWAAPDPASSFLSAPT